MRVFAMVAVLGATLGVLAAGALPASADACSDAGGWNMGSSALFCVCANGQVKVTLGPLNGCPKATFEVWTSNGVHTGVAWGGSRSSTNRRKAPPGPGASVSVKLICLSGPCAGDSHALWIPTGSGPYGDDGISVYGGNGVPPMGNCADQAGCN